MISLKKSYARQLLQLALTLSLLRVDPDTYLGWGWESQLALQNGDGWQLELRAAPLTDYPYSNRKALIPLIEDLVRFDRQTNPSTYDVQTYLLNVQNEQNSATTTTTSAGVNTLPAPVSGDTNGTVTTMASATSPLQAQSQTRNTTDFTVPVSSELADLFLLNSDPFGDTLSVLDQNLADLNDYADASTANEAFASLNQLYSGLPLKDETLDLFAQHNGRSAADNDDEQLLPSVATPPSTSNSYGSHGQNEAYGMLRNIESPTMNLSRVIEWSNYYDNLTKTEFKEEEAEDEGVVEETINTSNDSGSGDSTRIKSESEGDDDDRASSSDGKNSTSGFSSNVELTEEVINRGICCQHFARFFFIWNNNRLYSRFNNINKMTNTQYAVDKMEKRKKQNRQRSFVDGYDYQLHRTLFTMLIRQFTHFKQLTASIQEPTNVLRNIPTETEILSTQFKRDETEYRRRSSQFYRKFRIIWKMHS